MSTNFVLTLDTTAPDAAILIAAGAAYATAVDTTVVATSAAADATQMKVWGDVDNAFDPNVQTTEAASVWIAYSNVAKAIRLLAGDGVKQIFVRIRDDVGNASAPASDTITLDTTAPVPNITVAAAPAKISKVAGFDTSTFTFASDTDIQAWKVKVVPNAGADQSQGTQIPVGAGSANVSGGAKAAGVGVAVSIKGTDLEAASAGDGGKIVKVFVQDVAGIWSL